MRRQINKISKLSIKRNRRDDLHSDTNTKRD